jgi:ribosomal protein L6P/L9E
MKVVVEPSAGGAAAVRRTGPARRRTLLNMVEGVSTGFIKAGIVGVGYRAG